LRESLDSVQRQSFEDWECIVVDDGSTDDTRDIAQAHCANDARFIYMHQENRGLGAARNAGMRRAIGQFVQLLDADDLLEAEKLKTHVRYLTQNAECSLVYGSMRYFSAIGSGKRLSRGRGGSDRDWVKMWPENSGEMLIALVQGNLFPVSAAMIRRSVLHEVGYFDESLKSHEDWEFWLRLAFAGKRFCGLDEPGTMTLIREHGASLTTRAVTMAQTRLLVRERIDKLAPTDALRFRSRECANYDECDLGAALLAAGHWRAGVQRYLSGIAKADRKSKALRVLLAHVAPEWLLRVWRWLRWGAPSRETA
jgi:glycosyltransferase involved in cell wall biosynthesis